MKFLSIISSLERVPFVPVGLTELGTLTPQKMRELEELVSQLSKVWQVIEEPDFPWLGYRADKYNLEIRSELLTTLENINEILRELELETEDFSRYSAFFHQKPLHAYNGFLTSANFSLRAPNQKHTG